MENSFKIFSILKYLFPGPINLHLQESNCKCIYSHFKVIDTTLEWNPLTVGLLRSIFKKQKLSKIYQVVINSRSLWFYGYQNLFYLTCLIIVLNNVLMWRSQSWPCWVKFGWVSRRVLNLVPYYQDKTHKKWSHFLPTILSYRCLNLSQIRLSLIHIHGG